MNFKFHLSIGRIIRKNGRNSPKCEFFERSVGRRAVARQTRVELTICDDLGGTTETMIPPILSGGLPILLMRNTFQTFSRVDSNWNILVIFT